MLIASRFKSVGWVVTCALAALACYLVSLKVAAKRAELGGVEASVLAARQDIARLQTELGTRGRLVQLERWNADVLALSAPQAQQYVSSPVQLASFAAPPPPIAPAAPPPVQQAAAEQAAPSTEPKVIAANYSVLPSVAQPAQPAREKVASAAEDKAPAPVAKKVEMAAAAPAKKAKAAEHKLTGSVSVASASPVKKHKPSSDKAKSTALASAASKKTKADKAKKSEKTELASAKAKADKKAAKKESATRLASADKKASDKKASEKKDGAKRLASAERKSTEKKAKASKEASSVKLASTTSRRKAGKADAPSQATLRKTNFVKAKSDRVAAPQRIAMLDDRALTAIDRAARSEARTKKSHQ